MFLLKDKVDIAMHLLVSQEYGWSGGIRIHASVPKRPSARNLVRGMGSSRQLDPPQCGLYQCQIVVYDDLYHNLFLS